MNPIPLPRDFPPHGMPFRHVFTKTGPNQYAPRQAKGVLTWGGVDLGKEKLAAPPANFDLHPFLIGDYLFTEYSDGRFKPLPANGVFVLGKKDKDARAAVMCFKTTSIPLLGRHINWFVIPVYFKNQSGAPFKIWSIYINSIPIPHVHPALFDQFHGRLEATGLS